jgi:hypothetical protein
MQPVASRWFYRDISSVITNHDIDNKGQTSVPLLHIQS